MHEMWSENWKVRNNPKAYIKSLIWIADKIFKTGVELVNSLQ
jgi:hypothetical protein